MVYVGSSWVELDYWTSPSWGGYDARLRVLARSTQDIATNTSTVYFKLQKRVTGGSAYNYDPLDFEITCTDAVGGGHSATQTWTFGSVSSTSWEDVGGDDSDMYWSSVDHRADGTLTMTANAEGDRVLGGSFDTDITIQLPTIARASKPTGSPNPLTIGSSGATLTINTNRKSSSFMHTVKVQCGSWSWTSSARAVGASVTVAVPYSVIAQFSATSKTATATITCTTFSGSTQIGSAQTATLTLQIDANTDHPNIGTITVEDTNSRTSAVVGEETFIYGISTLQATIPLTVSGDYTELASATVTCGNQSQTYSLSGTSQTITFEFDRVNASSLSVTVKDKRGTSVSKSKSYTLMAYQPVTATGTVGRVSATGSTAVGQVSGVAYGGDYGQASNELTVTYKYKEHDSSTWLDSTYSATLSLNEGQQTYSHAITLLEEYDYQKQYDIQYIVNDLFNTATYVAQLMQGLPILSWDETEVDVFGNLHIHDRDNPTVWQDVMDGFDAVFDYNGQKNLCPVTMANQTVNGITYTVQSDGTVKANGTASADSVVLIGTAYVPSGSYIASGATGATNETYKIQINYRDTGNTAHTGIQVVADDTAWNTPSDYGGKTEMYIVIRSGKTVSNFIFKPMLRDARIASDEFIRFGAIPCYDINITKAISNISDVEFAFVTVYGRLCIANLKFTVSSTITNSTAVLFTGLPPAKRTYRTSFGETTGATKQIRVLVNTVGSFQNAWTSGGIPAGQYEGEIIYVMQ